MDAARKAAGDLVAGLKKHQAQLEKKGAWFRVILLGANPELKAKAGAALKGQYPSTSELTKASGWDLRSTRSSLDTSMEVQKLMGALSDGAEVQVLYSRGFVLVLDFSGG